MTTAVRTLAPLLTALAGGAFVIALTHASANAGTYALHESDILLTVASGRIVTGAVDTTLTPPGPTFPVRIFPVALSSSSAGATDPGYDCEPFTFAPGTTTGFNTLWQLRKWNGSSLQPIASPVLRLRLGAFQRYTGVDDTPVAGFGLSIPSDGTFHRHFAMQLFADRAATPVNTTAAAGVYAIKMEIWNSAPAIAPSEPHYLVLSLNASTQDRDAAIAYIADTFLSPAPLGCSPADIANTDGETTLTGGGPDNSIDNGDFTAFFSAFFLSDTDPARLVADIANTDGETALTGAGPDATVDNGDFTAFFASFFAGCP
jgi:hypothetical protein